MLCLTQNYDFTGAPHCVVPVAWDSSSKPWRISISDPNIPQTIQTLFVNPDNNSFTYQGASRYSGGDWTDGRLHYIPYSTLSFRPRTPVWEAVILLLSSLCLFASGDVVTSSLTDADGNDLDATGAAALDELERGRDISRYFVPVPSFDAADNRREFHCRHRPLGDPSTPNRESPVVARRGNRFGAVRSTGGSFRHVLTGARTGQFAYVMKHGLSDYRLSSDTRSKDHLEVGADRVGSHQVDLNLRSSRDRMVQLDLAHQLGVRGDRLELSISDLAVTSTRALETAISAGFGGLDVVPAASTVVKLETEYTVAGQVKKKTRTIRTGTGIRVDLSRLQADAKIDVTPIDHIGGPATGPVTAR